MKKREGGKGVHLIYLSTFAPDISNDAGKQGDNHISSSEGVCKYIKQHLDLLYK
jgi:hypothetical protein